MDPQPLAPPKDDPYTLEQLKEFDGSDASKPLYLAIKGTVFDVSSKRDMYGPGGSYALLAGKDASVALGKSSLKPEDAIPDWNTLEASEKQTLDQWHGFFTKKYNVVGKAKLSTSASAGKVRRKPNLSSSELDEIDFLAHPDTPEPTPTKTPRTKSAKTPRTAKKAATSGLVIISRPQAPETSASSSTNRAIASISSKSQRRIPLTDEGLIRQPPLDPDRTPRPGPTQRASFSSHPSGDEFEDDKPVPSVSARVASTLKPAVPGAARGRKKIPGRQLVRGDTLVDTTTPQSQPTTTRHANTLTSKAEPIYVVDSDDEVPLQSRIFTGKTSPTKTHSIARNTISSPTKRGLATGDSYVEYMVPMAGGDDDIPRGGISSGDEGVYISTSASEDEAARGSQPEWLQSKIGKGKGRAIPLGFASRATGSSPSKNTSRASSVSRASPPNYVSSSAYSSRAASPSPSSLRSGDTSHSSDSESDSGDSLYEHQHHVDPARNLEKLASLARMALTAAEDMRKKGVMREGEPPLPRSFLTGVVVESGKQRTKRPDASPSKKSGAKALESGTDAEDGEEVTIIRALPERRLGQVSEESVSRSRSWMDTVLSGPSGPQSQPLTSQTSSSSIASDSDNPFDEGRMFKRTTSQPLLSVTNTIRRPDIASSLPAVQSEPSLETVLSAYDMTPSRSRTMHINMSPSKNRVFGTPSRSRLFGTPSRTGRAKEVEADENQPPSQEFDEWLSRQQKIVLRALRDPPWATSSIVSTEPQAGEKAAGTWLEGDKDETEAVIKLRALLRRTVETGEGNSCLLVGPRGSGKTRTVMSALRTLTQAPRWQAPPRSSTPPPAIVPQTPSKHTGKAKQINNRTLQRPKSPTSRPPAPAIPQTPIVIHLSGYAQTNDRLAMREIARQLVLQSGEALDIPLGDDEVDGTEGPAGISVPTATHLPQIVGALARQVKPVVVVLDAFDLFAEHARQALLYCLLDTVQSCRAGEGSRGLAVVGVTSRVDCVTILEKRVKSRFSHRIIRISPPTSLDSYMSLVRTTMAISDVPNAPRLQTTPKKGKQHDDTMRNTWCTKWRDAVERVLSDRQFKQVMEDAFELSRDVRLLLRVLSGTVINLSPTSPWLTIGAIARSIQAQCAPSPFTFLQELAYPCVALLIATQHTHDRGHDAFTFKMLCAEIKRELGNEAVTKALVHMQGRGLGLIRVPEPVLESVRHFAQDQVLNLALTEV
ncbi:hypothetical protein FRC07_014093 [Ceratobasidium sp. 392]|nr:hypothetical protein FRC07_014093 [Ceratobasidium sp. 392]